MATVSFKQKYYDLGDLWMNRPLTANLRNRFVNFDYNLLVTMMKDD